MNEINKQLSEYFLSDARDYLLRYNELEENATHIGLRSKLVVELMFSLECSLKSLFFLETDLDEKEAYKKIKKMSHDIRKIVGNLSEESREVFNEKVTIDYENYKVYYRYMFESEMVFRENFGVLGLKYYETINNPSWRESFCNQIKAIIEYVESKNPFELKTINFSDIDINAEISKYEKLKNIIT